MAAALPFACGCSKTPPPTRNAAAPIDKPALTLVHPHLESAERAIERGNYPHALELIESASDAPKSDRLRLRTDVFRKTDYLDLEMKSLFEWARAAPHDTEPLLRLFYIYIDLGWRQEAGEVSAKALKLDSEDYAANVARAVHFYRSPEPILALPFIDRALAVSPRNPAASNLKATVLLKSRRFPAAEKAAREAVTLEPKNPRNHLALAHALSNLARSAESESALKEAIRLEPANPEALFELGRLAQKREDTPAAIALFEKVAASDTQFGNVAFRLGSLYLKHGKPAEGRKLMEMFRKMDATTSAYETALSRLYSRPNDAGMHYKLARFHLEAEEFPQAIVELKKTLQINATFPQAKRDLIHALMRHGRTTEAQTLMASNR